MITLLILLSLPARAETWKVGDRTVELVPAGNALLSEGCVRNGKPGGCRAAKALGKKRAPRGKGGANPSALLCEKLGGEVRIGRDADRNEKCLCEFPDASFAACASLGKK